MLIGLLITWIVVIVAMRKGVEKMARIVKWIVIIPVVIHSYRIIVQAVSMPGASKESGITLRRTGLRLATPPGVWRAAFGAGRLQYEYLFADDHLRLLQKDGDIPKDSIVIGLATWESAATPVLWCSPRLATFPSERHAIADMNYQGVMLAFVDLSAGAPYFPEGMWSASFLAPVLYHAVCLAIDSLFSIVQAVLSSLKQI